jgi:hypothetical protein
MELEICHYCFHESANCPYPESEQSNPRSPIWCRPILILSSINAYVFQLVSFRQVSPPNACKHLTFPCYKYTDCYDTHWFLEQINHFFLKQILS